MKDFDSWNKKKKYIEQIQSHPLSYHEREIWWCSFGLNLGDEQDGKNSLYERPALIMKKFNAKVAWVLPMSSKEKIGKYYHSLPHDGKGFIVILSQLRLVSTKRFRRFVRKISPHQFKVIQEKLISIIKN